MTYKNIDLRFNLSLSRKWEHISNSCKLKEPISLNPLWSLFFVFIILIIFGFITSAFAQDFTIDKFHADITISENSSLTVKERIDVEFQRPKHGIYREMPFKYIDELGNTIKTPLKVLSVTDESGKEREYKVNRKGNVIYIRIGDPDRYVSGHQIYVITYKVENAVLFFDDHDELYWNVTGNYWKAPIRDASANVVLTVGNTSKNIWASCYTGVSGSRRSECIYETYPNSVEFFSKKNLSSGEGFTIAFGWDKGLVYPPSSWRKFLWALDIRENWVFFLPVLSLIFMINLWHKRGRDPKVRESITVRYEPPKFGNNLLIPAEVGALVDEKIDSRDITSTIVGLAVKGFIKIEEIKREGLIFDSSDYYLAKIKEPDETLCAFEILLMKKIFSGDLPGIMVSDLKNRFYRELDLLKTTLYSELVRKKYFLVNPYRVRRFYIASGIIVAFIGFFSASIFTPLSFGKGAIAGIMTAFPVFLFSRFMPAKTRAGASVYMDILGFQEFMSRAEKDRLERMGDKELFSKFLPYAIALDVVDNWARAFEGIYQESPKWYVSHDGLRTFTPYSFSRSIGSATSSLAAAIYSAPRGSGVSGGGGFGGGGSSGGGFGGGGGGSW